MIHKDLLDEFIHIRSLYPEYAGFVNRTKMNWEHLETIQKKPARDLSAYVIEKLEIGLQFPFVDDETGLSMIGTRCYEDEWITVFFLRIR